MTVKDFAAALAMTAKKLAGALERIGECKPPALAQLSADVCAQTIAYGMFACWSEHDGKEVFSRYTAALSIPKSHPFLNQLFDYIASPNVDERVGLIVDTLSALLASCPSCLCEKNQDLHFYEDFLAAYNPDQRKSRGVFYTPLPAVIYIVRAVDDILRQEFNLQDGIADKTVHIFDPAMGTGAFFREMITQIYHRIAGKSGHEAWNHCDANDLLPRLHGYEVLAAPYLIAHLHLTMLLQNFGYWLTEDQRLNLHLTNALGMVGCRPPGGNAGDSRLWLDADNTFRTSGTEYRTQPSGGRLPTLSSATTVILGNPPYNVSTANRDYAKDLTAKYKEGLKHETNIQPLSDDYIKFIALGQHLIEAKKTGGILAYISNNSFLDGVIHWKMRQSLLETFDKIYVLNLHGNSRKKETAPDGSRDENIFCIKQGVSINIFVRSPAFFCTQRHKGMEESLCCASAPPCETKNDVLGKIFYADLYGKRSDKLQFLEAQTLAMTNFTEFIPTAPDYFFIPKDFSLKAEYDKGFGVNQLFIKQGTGIKFRKDNLLVKNHFIRKDVETMLHDIEQLEDQQVLEKYKITETHDWQLKHKRQYFLHHRPEDIVPVLYRVFDMRWTYYPRDKISHIIVRGDARKDLMQHLFRENLVLLTLRNQPTVQEFDRVFIATGIIEHCVIGRGTYAFPLYWYDKNGKKCLNLNEEIVGKLFSHEGTKAQRKQKPSARDIFDYVYGVLHDPQYRAKYQEFLKWDFPRVPYPKDEVEFDQHVQVGSRLRKLHLLEKVPEIQTTFPITGNNMIENVRFATGKVFINHTQYFADVPDSVWNFPIGGSCPAQKYLKDRKGRVLSCEEIVHYQKIVAVLR